MLLLSSPDANETIWGISSLVLESSRTPLDTSRRLPMTLLSSESAANERPESKQARAEEKQRGWLGRGC